MNFVELARFGWLPYSLHLGVRFATWLFAQAGMRPLAQQFVSIFLNAIILTPFAVTWIRLAILGPQSVAKRQPFAYGRIELLYLFAYSLLMLAVIVLLGIPIMIAQSAMVDYYSTRDTLPLAGVGVLLIGGLFVTLILCVRVSFVFPAIAIQRYVGFKIALGQTRSYLERLLAINFISGLLFAAVQGLLSRAEMRHGSVLATIAFEIAVAAVRLVLEAVLIGATALAYKFLVFDTAAAQSPQTSSAISVN